MKNIKYLLFATTASLFFSNFVLALPDKIEIGWNSKKYSFFAELEFVSTNVSLEKCYYIDDSADDSREWKRVPATKTRIFSAKNGRLVVDYRLPTENPECGWQVRSMDLKAKLINRRGEAIGFGGVFASYVRAGGFPKPSPVERLDCMLVEGIPTCEGRNETFLLPETSFAFDVTDQGVQNPRPPVSPSSPPLPTANFSGEWKGEGSYKQAKYEVNDGDYLEKPCSPIYVKIWFTQENRENYLNIERSCPELSETFGQAKYKFMVRNGVLFSSGFKVGGMDMDSFWIGSASPLSDSYSYQSVNRLEVRYVPAAKGIAVKARRFVCKTHDCSDSISKEELIESTGALQTK